MRKLIQISFLALTLFSLWGCKGMFGEKTNLDFIDKPVYVGREVAYVPIQPVLDNFVRPTKVLAGWDELFYVVDEGTSEIISFDLSGRELQRITVPGLKAIAQDRSLDLLAIGTYDTLESSGQVLTLTCVYRISQKSGASLGLQYGNPRAVFIHPYYKGIRTATDKDEIVQFEDLATLADFSYFITRTGPNNNPLQLGGPDDVVLYAFPGIDGTLDSEISPISIQTGAGFVPDYFSKPNAITSIAQPPQNPLITPSRDFIWTSIDADLALKTQYIKYEETVDGGIYSLKEMPTDDTSKADGFLYEPDKFSRPRGVTYAVDRTNYIFVVDAEKDSLYQFTNEGYEGVNPPPFSNETKQILASFGGTGINLNQFNEPTGVAYYDNIVYVADAGNGRVLRFKLTSDFD